MKNRLKILPELESIINDEFLTFDCRFLTPSGKNVEQIFCLDQKDAEFDTDSEKTAFSSIQQLLAPLNRDQRQGRTKNNLFSTLRPVLRRKEL